MDDGSLHFSGMPGDKRRRWHPNEGVTVLLDPSRKELRSQEIAAWRMTIPPGYRFEATQALRQVLARAVVRGMLDINPAKQESRTRSGGAPRSVHLSPGPS